MQSKAIQLFVQKQLQKQKQVEKPKLEEQVTNKNDRKPHKLMRPMKKKILKKPKKQDQKKQEQYKYKRTISKNQQVQNNETFKVYKPNEKVMSRLKYYL